MRVQKVKRYVDDIARNKRMIFHMACGHNVIYTERDLRGVSGPLYQQLQRLALEGVPIEELACPQCPDPPPAPPEDPRIVALREFKMWKEPRGRLDD